MNENVYKNNIEALKVADEQIGKVIENKEYSENEEVQILTEISSRGDIIFKAVSNERVLYLEGKYNPEGQVENWLSIQKKFEFESVVIIIGFGNGSHIKRILKETKDTVVLMVYEPCVNIFLKAMEEIDLTEIFKSGRVALFIDGITSSEIKAALEKLIIFDTLNILHHFISGNYAELFPVKVKEFLGMERFRIEQVGRSFGTVINFTDVNGLNVLNNITYIYDNYATFQLKGMLPPDVPSIIVAAGPSLNKNIDDLKEVKGRACIIATDTALKPLLNRGIKPDFLVMVDGKKPGLLFEHELLSEVPLVMSPVVSKEPVNMHKGKKFFSWDGTRYETDLIKVAKDYSSNPEKIDLISIPTGGSVATTAFSFACILGSKTVILMGQDLALTGNKTHADGTFRDKMEELDISKGKYIEVEDIYGNTVLTRPDYKSYLDWFNDYIPSLKEIHVIDATEGGAKITGTEILTLKETIERECIKEVNIKELLDEIPPIFSEPKVKEKIREYLNETPAKFEELKDKVKRGIGYYEKIIDLCSKKNFNAKEYVKLSRKVSNLIENLNNDGIALMAIDSMRHVDYSLRAIAYTTEDKEEDERINIAKHGKVYLESMIPYIDDLKPYAEETVGKVGR